jgi:membrane protein DedA with SNARE-associated domain
LIVLGWNLGGQWREVELFTSFVGFAVLSVLILATLIYFWRRLRVQD